MNPGFEAAHFLHIKMPLRKSAGNLPKYAANRNTFFMRLFWRSGCQPESRADEK